jgi:outer membrane protein OmpA-like peptidoglycan-associated protein
MKYLNSFLLSCLTLFTFAQNLVPNANFTENDYGRVRNWLQPVDDYYHYEVWRNNNDSEYTFNAVNGICLLQPEKSEFLVAELKQPLEKGKRYCASLKIYFGSNFIGNVKQVQSIDMAFSDTAIKVLERRLLFLPPKLKFDFVDDNVETYQPASIIFEADGTERFVIIGKFHTPDGLLTFEGLKHNLYRQQYYAADSIKKYYTDLMPKMDAASSKKMSKRDIKKFEEEVARIDAERIHAIRENAAKYNQKLILLLQSDSIADLLKAYHVRVYLDDICIAPMLENNECYCELDEKETFSVGQTYRLNNIQFDLDKSTFKPESYGEMDNLYKVLIQHPGMEIQLNGHTDSLNTEKYNLDLSNRRAKAVYDYLVKKGIPAKRLRWKGFGESIPLTENETEAGRAINRRVEFLILKN